jgi:nitroreductase
MSMSVTEALYTRISTRDFLPDPVPESVMRDILDAARWSPSGGNLQPWRVVVVTGAERQAVIDLAHTTLAANPAGDDAGYPMYPANLWEPYRTRRFKIGEDMYATMGIERENKPARYAHVARNMEFFGAPVGMFFIIDKGMGHGQWAHLGMFIQSVALAAIERGVQSCIQEAWAPVRGALGQHFGIADNEVIYCGMALGHANPANPVNTLRSDRCEVDEIATFRGF